MTTLIDTVQPPLNYLEEQLMIGRGNRSEEEWLNVACDSLIGNLKSQPMLYVSFGPWWYTLKNILIEHGADFIGRLIELDVATIYTMPRPALAVCAAILYHNDRINYGMMYDRAHLLEVNENADDTEPYYFTVEDEEMDRLVQQRGNLNGNTNAGLTPGTNPS